MALWQTDVAPEPHLRLVETLEDVEAMPTLGFEEAYIHDAPWKAYGDPTGICVYEHMLFKGAFEHPRTGQVTQLVIRQSGTIARRNGRDPGSVPVGRGLLVATDDGERIDEWRVDETNGEPGQALGEGEFIMQISRPVQRGWREREAGGLKLSRYGGVIRPPRQSEWAWLIGHDAFAHELPFL